MGLTLCLKIKCGKYTLPYSGAAGDSHEKLWPYSVPYRGGFQAQRTFRKIKARILLALQLTLNTSTTTMIRLNSLNLLYELGGCKVPKNDIPDHA